MRGRSPRRGARERAVWRAFQPINLTRDPATHTICKRMRIFMTIGIALWTTAVGFGCAESSSSPSDDRPWLTARFALTGAQCVEHENQDTQFPSDADRVVARVSGFSDPTLPPIIQTIPAGSQNAAGEVVIDQHVYVGARFLSAQRVERVSADVNAAHTARLPDADGSVRYISGAALSAGQYALFGKGDTQMYVVEVLPR